MKPIFFIGFMGVGKTTIGKRLGEIVNLPVIDMDRYIENNEKKSIKEIFDVHGEKYFRDVESEALKELLTQKAIITTGGGVVEKEANRECLREDGLVLHLTCPFDALWERLENDGGRPLVQNNSKEGLRVLFERRLPLYESAGTVKIDTENKTVDEVIEAILPHLEGHTV